MQWVFTCLNVLWVWALCNDSDGEVDGGQTERESGCEGENIRSGSHFCSEGSDSVMGLELVEGFPQSLIKPSNLFYTHTSRYSSSISHPAELCNTEMKSTSGFILIRRLQEAAEVKSVCTCWSVSFAVLIRKRWSLKWGKKTLVSFCSAALNSVGLFERDPPLMTSLSCSCSTTTVRTQQWMDALGVS